MKKILITCLLVSICGVTPFAYANDSLSNLPDQTRLEQSILLLLGASLYCKIYRQNIIWPNRIERD